MISVRPFLIFFIGVYERQNNNNNKVNLVNFARAEPKSLEIQIYLLNRKITFWPPEKDILSQSYVKSDSFQVFRKTLDGQMKVK